MAIPEVRAATLLHRDAPSEGHSSEMRVGLCVPGAARFLLGRLTQRQMATGWPRDGDPLQLSSFLHEEYESGSPAEKGRQH